MTTELRINFGAVTQGSQPTKTFIWPLDAMDAPNDLTGFVITGKARSRETGDVTALSGVFAVVDGVTRECTWAMSALDTGTDGTYAIVLNATDGSDNIYSLAGSLYVEDNPAVSATQNPPLVGVPADDASHLSELNAAFSAGDIGDVYVINNSNESEFVAPPWFPYAVPSADFSYVPFAIQRNDMKFRPALTWDISDLAPTGTAYYVSINTGNDSAAGTEGAPWRTLQKALTTPDAVEVFVEPGVYAWGNGWAGTNPARDISIKRWGGAGDVIVNTQQRVMAWQVAGGYSDTYETVNTTYAPQTVLDAATLDSDGNYTALTSQVSVADVDANPGSYFWDGVDTTYVRTADSRVADSNVWLMMGIPNGLAAGDITVYLENIKFYGSSTEVFQAQSNGAAQNPKLYAKNCDFSYGTLNGFKVLGTDAIMQNCQAYRNGQDGFSYNQYLSVTEPKLIEIDCISYQNGTSAGNTYNASTSHQGCKIIRLNGTYHDCHGPLIADVGDSIAANMGCIVTDSLPTLTSQNAGIYTENIAYADRCTVSGSYYDLVAKAAGDIIYNRESSYDSYGIDGSITDY